MELIQLAVPVLLKGLWMTLTLTALSVAIGFNLGLGLAILRGSDNSWLSGFARYYSIVFRGTPLLVQIFLIYYGLGQIKFIHDTPAMWWVVSEGSRCAVLALALNTAAYTSEILRGGLVAVPAGLVEAAKACGMSRFLTMRRVILPQMLRYALPGMGNLWLSATKDSSLISVLGNTQDLLFMGYRASAVTKHYGFFYSVAAILFLVITIVSMIIIRVLEARVNRGYR